MNSQNEFDLWVKIRRFCLVLEILSVTPAKHDTYLNVFAPNTKQNTLFLLLVIRTCKSGLPVFSPSINYLSYLIKLTSSSYFQKEALLHILVNIFHCHVKTNRYVRRKPLD